MQFLISTHTLIVHWIGKKSRHSTNVVNLLREIMFFEEKLDVELQTQVLKLGLFCTKCYPRAILLETKMHCSTLWGVQVPGKLKNSGLCSNNLFFIFRGTLTKNYLIISHLAHVMQSDSSKAVEPPIPFRSNHSKSTCLYWIGKCWYVEPSTATRARECSNLLQGIVLNTWMHSALMSRQFKVVPSCCNRATLNDNFTTVGTCIPKKHCKRMKPDDHSPLISDFCMWICYPL